MEVEPIGNGETARVPAAPPGKQVPALTLAQRRAGGSKGGKRSRQNVLLVGIADLPDKLDLKTNESRLAVLEALALAIARGRTSALAATTLVSVIKEARAEATAELERRVNELAAKLDALTA